MKFFSDLRNMLTSSGSDNKISSKRLITFLAFIFVSIAFFADLFFNKSVSENLFDGMIQIVWAGLGVVVGEHLLKARNNNTEVSTTEDDTVETELPEGAEFPEPEGELGDN